MSQMGVAWIGLWVWPGLADGCGLDWHVSVTWLACGCDLDRHVGVAWVGICVWPKLAYGCGLSWHMGGMSVM